MRVSIVTRFIATSRAERRPIRPTRRRAACRRGGTSNSFGPVQLSRIPPPSPAQDFTTTQNPKPRTIPTTHNSRLNTIDVSSLERLPPLRIGPDNHVGDVAVQLTPPVGRSGRDDDEVALGHAAADAALDARASD